MEKIICDSEKESAKLLYCETSRIARNASKKNRKHFYENYLDKYFVNFVL